jgi:subtilase family serine protease
MISKKLCLYGFLLLLTVFAASRQAMAQDLNIAAQPPIHVKGNAQAATVGLTPSQIRRAYGFDPIPNQGAGQTIGIIDAFRDPHIESDLATFDQEFNLPACTTNNGCFQEIAASGNPGNNALWALETALDVEWAHAIAPQARIMLVEARSDKLSDLIQAVDVAVQQGANVISMSWGAAEFSGETAFDNHFLAAKVSFVASSGDFGTGVLYPSTSPNVTGAGGTTLSLDSNGNYLGETAWSGSGGGLSGFEVEPNFQSQFKIPNDSSHDRGAPDVAYNSDPNTGVAVYDSVPYQGSKGWLQVGGTSAASPQWSGLLAIANSSRFAVGKSPLSGSNAALYDVAKKSFYSADYHDITSGTNGTCLALCTATPSYDYVTGLGSPQAHSLINALVAAP